MLLKTGGRRLDTEILSTLADATEKTQKPFIRRAVARYRRLDDGDDGRLIARLKGILKERVKHVLQMTDKLRAYQILDYFRQILPTEDEGGEVSDITEDLDWHNKSGEFIWKPDNAYLSSSPDKIPNTMLFRRVEACQLEADVLSRVIVFLYLQLIFDVGANRAQHDHIAPAINRLRSKQVNIMRLFSAEGGEFWKRNVVVVNLRDVNLEMKKTIPLLLSKTLYSEQKAAGSNTSLSIIIDEAHTVLSTESYRESESWKDYRLETFEEIVKEGRKFGVFVTITSQRPNDISPTITSQAHNYFIHRLVNQKDLATISSAVSYIDRVTEESIPTLPVGSCIVSGVASHFPLKVQVRALNASVRPQSNTRAFRNIVHRRSRT